MYSGIILQENEKTFFHKFCVLPSDRLTPKNYEAYIFERMEVVSLDVVPIKVVKEAREPAHHDLVVLPAMDKLTKQGLSMMTLQ